MMEAGCFARNTIHRYITFIYYWRKVKRDEEKKIAAVDLVGGLIVQDSDLSTPGLTGFYQEGIARQEHPSELIEVPATLELIKTAKHYLDKLNGEEMGWVDNLSYVEILSKLVEKEKAIQNENGL